MPPADGLMRMRQISGMPPITMHGYQRADEASHDYCRGALAAEIAAPSGTRKRGTKRLPLFSPPPRGRRALMVIPVTMIREVMPMHYIPREVCCLTHESLKPASYFAIGSPDDFSARHAVAGRCFVIHTIT